MRKNRILTAVKESAIGLFKPVSEYVFIISHTRSGSSLLTNLILSSGLNGLGELHIGYNRLVSYARMKGKISLMGGMTENNDIYLDKLLSDEYFPIKIRKNVKFIFLTRELIPVYRSNMKMYEKVGLYKGDEFSSFKKYYKKNAEGIVELYKKVDEAQKCIISYENLISDTKNQLAVLSDFLGIEVSEQYVPQADNKNPYLGDYSKKFLSGTINKSHNSSLRLKPENELERDIDTSLRTTYLELYSLVNEASL